MSIHLDVGNLKELARATQKAVLSLSPSDQDAAIQTISARILGTEHPVGSASHPRAVVPPPELTEEEEEILAQHLELLKGVKWAKIEREIGKYVPDPDPELRAKNFKAATRKLFPPRCRGLTPTPAT